MKSTLSKLMQMGDKGGHASDATQVSPPVSGGPSGGGKSQSGKAEVNNPSQYGKPPTLGPRKGNMKTPKFEDVVATIKAVKEGTMTAEEAVVALYFEDADDGDGEGSEEDGEEGSPSANPDDDDGVGDTSEKKKKDKKDTDEPGGGGRFKKLAAKLKGKVKDPKAVAAAIGRKKYGKKGFQKMASQGDSTDQAPANISEADLPSGNAAVATASGSNAGQAPTPKVDGPKAGKLLKFTPGAVADATTMGAHAEQLRKWLDDAVSQKKLWVGGIFVHKNGPNEFHLDGIAKGDVSLDAAVKACVQFGDIKLAPPGAPSNDLK